MGIRDRLKGIKPEEVATPVPLHEGPTWACGADVPTTWKKKELKKMRKKTLKQNLKLGVISKKVYKLLKGGKYE